MNKLKSNIFIRSTCMVIVCSLIMSFASGCSTFQGEPYDENRMLAQYYNQQRTYEPFAVKGAQEIIFRAPQNQTVEMKVSTPLDPLHQYTPPKSTGQTAIEAVSDVAKYGIIGFTAYKGLETLAAKSVVNPVVVRPEVVRPDVIIAGGG